MPFSVLEELSIRGVSFSDEDFRYRFRDGEIHVGYRPTFNKWSDSTDFRFSVPKTQRACDAIFKVLNDFRLLAKREDRRCERKAIRKEAKIARSLPPAYGIKRQIRQSRISPLTSRSGKCIMKS